MSTAEAIDLITEAGLDYHDFKVAYLANFMGHATETTFWEAASEYARTDRGYFAACALGGITPESDE